MSNDQSKRLRSVSDPAIDRSFENARIRNARRLRWPQLGPQLWELEVAQEIDEDDLVVPETVSANMEQTRRGRLLKPTKTALVQAAFDASTTPEIRRRLLGGLRQSVVVSVPDMGWVGPVKGYLCEFMGAQVYARDGSDRQRDRPSTANDQIASALSMGRSVVGISQNPQHYLPSLLIASADLRIEIKPPTPQTLARAMRLCLRGRVPRELPPGLAAGLSFHEIVAALRCGSKPAEAVKRLCAASQARESANGHSKLPALQDAEFYGAARDWGLALAKDIDAARRGEIEWRDVDRGAVLFGKPGVGKSWLARMLGQACGVPVIETSVADLFATGAGYLDSVIKNQRALFERAAATAPCILFLDELDAMPNRATLSPRGKDWWLPVIEDFLVLVSNVAPGITLLGCTNRIDDIDAALLRPGRFERQIEIKPAATAEGLAQILRFQLDSDLADADLVPVARLGLGATAAEAMDWVRSARRFARQAGRCVTIADLSQAVAPPDKRDFDALRRDAIHEAAHAVVAILLGFEKIDHVSVVVRGASAGRMRLETSGEIGQRDREQIENFVTVRLAGRAAEMVFFGSASAGAGGVADSDLAVATQVISALHLSFGLGDSLVYHDDVIDRNLVSFDPSLRKLIDGELRRLSQHAEDLVKKHALAVESIANALIERRHLSGADVEELMRAAGHQSADDKSRPLASDQNGDSQ